MNTCENFYDDYDLFKGQQQQQQQKNHAKYEKNKHQYSTMKNIPIYTWLV